MKCVRCGRLVGLTARGMRLFDGNYICFKCFDALGFDKSDRKILNNTYTWNEIKNGKEAYLNPKKNSPLREYTFKVAGVTFDQGDGDPQKILKKYQAENCDRDYQYDGMTNKDIKEDLNYDDKVYQFEPVEFSPLLERMKFEGKDAIRVSMDTESDAGVLVIGWIPADKVETVNALLDGSVYDITGAVTGGKYKYLSYPDDKVETETDNFGATITIKIQIQ